MSAIPSLNGSLHGVGAQDTRVTGRAANPRLNLEGAIDASTKADSVELSSEAIEQSLKFEAPSRADLIASIKAQIADGSYNEDDKLTIVADRIASELKDK
ncbi:MAG: flagellar biosynthesis anti-sigma factor FlgM [Phycisphaerales bacterium]